GWMAFVGFACFALVAAAVLLRVARSAATPGFRAAGVALALGLPIAIFVWYHGGPQQHGWAARAGTPVSLLRRAHGAAPSGAGLQTSLPAGSFDSTLAGNHVDAQLANASGARLDLGFILRLSGRNNAVAGSIHGRTVS